MMEMGNPNTHDAPAELEKLLARLSSAINEQTTHQAIEASLDNLDAYLLEVNRFYYQTFHQEFFPVYKQELQEEIAHLLRIHHQEGMLKQDILANLRRLVKLYNQVKTISTRLEQLRADLNQDLLAFLRQQEQQPLEMLAGLKQLRDALALLLVEGNQLIELAADQTLMNALEELGSDGLSLLASLGTLLPGPSRRDEGMHRLLFYGQKCARLLSPLSTKTLDAVTARRLAADFAETLAETKKDPALKSLSRFLESWLYQNIDLCGELFSLYARQGETTRLRELASHLGQRLNPALTVGDRLLYLLSKRPGPLPAEPQLLLDLYRSRPLDWWNQITGLQEKVEGLVELLSSSSQPDLGYFSQRINDLLEQFAHWLEASPLPEAAVRSSLLQIRLAAVDLEMRKISEQMRSLEAKNRETEKIRQSLLEIQQLLDKQLTLLGNTRGDMERVLAPRNLSRFWKDMQIRVERVPLQSGHPFPHAYNYLLEKYQVETHLDDQLEGGPVILYEEGDLFIIRVDDLLEEELPYLIMAEKG